MTISILNTPAERDYRGNGKAYVAIKDGVPLAIRYVRYLKKDDHAFIKELATIGDVYMGGCSANEFFVMGFVQENQTSNRRNKMNQSLNLAINLIKENLPAAEADKFAKDAKQALNSCTNPALARDKFVYWMLGGDQSEPTPFNRPDLLEMTAEVRELYRQRIAGKQAPKEKWETARNNALAILAKTNGRPDATICAACAVSWAAEPEKLSSTILIIVWLADIEESRVNYFRIIANKLIAILRTDWNISLNAIEQNELAMKNGII